LERGATTVGWGALIQLIPTALKVALGVKDKAWIRLDFESLE